ncbi:MAG: NUDIX domain-containing protein [Chloroflexi bacterium]|nr:NUDIX domain-containing protein [Chloroflexota bacterium]
MLSRTPLARQYSPVLGAVAPAASLPSARAGRRLAVVERHFTVSGFLSHDGRTALHWHRLGLWLPPGGHIQANEDPIQAVLREIEEETGVEALIVPTSAPYLHVDPRQLPPPVTVGVYEIDEPGNPHEHIDFVYFTRPRSPGGSGLPDLPGGPHSGEGWRWVGREELRDPGVVLGGPGGSAQVPEDVRRLALDAIDAAAEALAASPADAERRG